MYVAAFLAALAGVPALADGEGTTELTEMMTAYDARGWEGVGRLNIGWGGMCTGAMIAPNLVLTAGHCLYNSRTGNQVNPATIQFHAGWRNGHASASRKVRRAVIHPDYVFTGPESDNLTVSNDLAILELDSDIRLANIQPFTTGKRPRKGATVGVVSYAHDRAESPSIQETCHVLARRQGALVLSCDVDFGSSGAPIFAEVDGTPQIVSVVSAKGEVRGRRVSLGTNLEKPLSEMMVLLKSGGGVSARKTPEVRMMKPDTPRTLTSGGAKFLRP
ncbi:MAG: trypsin-like serine protease [Silicimonas sp.]|nr:trypsin-like serine protease [Silicimonas sp.]